MSKTFGILCFLGPVCHLPPGLILTPFLTAEIGAVTGEKKRTYQLKDTNHYLASHGIFPGG